MLICVIVEIPLIGDIIWYFSFSFWTWIFNGQSLTFKGDFCFFVPFSGLPDRSQLSSPAWSFGSAVSGLGIFWQMSHVDRQDQAKRKQLFWVGSFHICSQLSQLAGVVVTFYYLPSLSSNWKGLREVSPAEGQPARWVAELVGGPRFCYSMFKHLPPSHGGAWGQGSRGGLGTIMPIGNAEWALAEWKDHLGTAWLHPPHVDYVASSHFL